LSASRGKGFALAAAANVLGGLSYLGQKLALQGLPPATVCCLRGVVAIAVMGLWLRLRRTTRVPWSGRDLRLLALMGTIGYGLPMWLGIVGVERSTSANGSILVLIEPMMVLVFAALLLKERVSPRQVLGVAVGLLGALLLVLEGASLESLFGGEHLEGNLILALHGFLWGTFTPLVKPLAARHDPVQVILRGTAVSLFVVGPAAMFEHERWQAGPALWPALFWVVALALGGSFASAVLWAAATRHVPAATIAPFVFIQPVTGVAAGALVLGERFTPLGAVGAAVIAVGVAIVLRDDGEEAVSPARRRGTAP
jgi:drug/metabolite transporter (DMT)-like permease